MTTPGDTRTTAELPFGAAELLEAVSGARRVLDAGCGSGRLTVALAGAHADVTGIDTSSERLEQARRRAAGAGIALRLVDADLNEPLPFADAAFDAVTSRLVLLIPDDPVATLRELRRVLAPEGRLATVLWASLEENPWFAAPREAVAAVLGEERASFARAFGRLGDPEDAAAVHRAAGLADVEVRVLRERVLASGGAEHWHRLAEENDHFRRVDAALGDDEGAAVVSAVDERLARYRDGSRLSVPRTLVLVMARR
jgi:SAM-dependent methyltransferase